MLQSVGCVSKQKLMHVHGLCILMLWQFWIHPSQLTGQLTDWSSTALLLHFLIVITIGVHSFSACMRWSSEGQHYRQCVTVIYDLLLFPVLHLINCLYWRGSWVRLLLLKSPRKITKESGFVSSTHSIWSTSKLYASCMLACGRM